jgi:predicted acetyltransferase
MVNQVTLSAPPDDQLAFVLHDPRIKQRIKPYSMARIIDVKGFMEHYSFVPQGDDVDFILHISDDAAPWNDGKFKVRVDLDGNAAVKQDNDLQSGTNMISCDIQSLSAMLTGYQRPSILHSIGRISGEPQTVKDWDAVIPKRTVYLTDFF